MTRHKHADLIIAWANDTSLVIETRYDNSEDWHVTSTPSWCEHFEYRIKPNTILIGDIEVPCPETVKPKVGCLYYIPFISDDMVFSSYWIDSDFDNLLLKSNMVHLHADAAIQHTRALIKVSGGTLT